MKKKIDLMARIIGNPFYCILMSPALCKEHPMMISKKQWIQANVALAKEIGVEEMLENILENLEGEYV